MRTITQSELRCFRRCQRKHQFAYLLKRRPVVQAHALTFGVGWHTAQEAYWRHGLSTGLAVLTALDPLDAAICAVLLEGYDARWGSDEFELLGAEIPFEMPLVNPLSGRESQTYRIAGKIDALVRQGSRLLVVEHKTSSEDTDAGSMYWERLRLDGQVSIYLDGARALGYQPDACLYDVVRKPRHRPLLATPVEARKYTKAGALYANQRDTDETLQEYQDRLRAAIAEDPSGYYQRGEVVRIGDERKDAAFDTWQTARLIREAEITGRHPRNPDSCVLFGRCEYLPVCTGECSIEDPRYRTAETEHEELRAA